MNWRKATKIGLIVGTGVVVLYDVVALSRGGVDSTISRVVLGWARAQPILPFGVGVLCGHLFWSQPTPDEAGRK